MTETNINNQGGIFGTGNSTIKNNKIINNFGDKQSENPPQEEPNEEKIKEIEEQIRKRKKRTIFWIIFITVFYFVGVFALLFWAVKFFKEDKDVWGYVVAGIDVVVALVYKNVLEGIKKMFEIAKEAKDI